MFDRLAVHPRSGAERVVGHHAADGCAAGRRDVGGEPDIVRPQRRVQLVEHDARLDPRPPLGGVHLEDAIEILRRVGNQAGANRLPGLRRAAAAHRQRASKLRADADQTDEIVAGLRQHDAERLDLIDAGVGGVERAGDLVEPDFALELLLEFLAKRAHSRERPWASRSSPSARVSPPLANDTRSVPSPPGPYAEPCTTATLCSWSSRRRISSDGRPAARTSTIAKNPPSGASTRAWGIPLSVVRTWDRRLAYSCCISATQSCGWLSATAAASCTNVEGPRLDCWSTSSMAEMSGAGAAQ